MQQNGFAGAYVRPLPTTVLELVATNAAREAYTTSVGVHHAAIATRKSEQWHQIPWMCAAKEPGFKAEQIRAARWAAQVLRWQRARLPGAVRGNDELRPQNLGLSRALFDDRAVIATIVVDEPGERPRLPILRPGRGGTLKQQRVELFTTYGTAAVLRLPDS